MVKCFIGFGFIAPTLTLFASLPIPSNSSCAKNEDNKVDIKSDLYGTWFSSCKNYKKTSFNYDLDLQKVKRTLYDYFDIECVYLASLPKHICEECNEET